MEHIAPSARRWQRGRHDLHSWQSHGQGLCRYMCRCLAKPPNPSEHRTRRLPAPVLAAALHVVLPERGSPGKGPSPSTPCSLPTSRLFHRLRQVLKKYLRPAAAAGSEAV